MRVSFFMPEYMKGFSCVGPNCTDTCCAGWDVNIDEATFNKYENSSDNLKALVKDKYIRSNILDDSFNYGFMIIGEENKCPFLNKNMLCDIHGSCGEDNLSITCKRYPRVFNIVDDIYEKSGLPSCSEVCNKAFLNKEKMEFIEWEEDLDEDAVEIRRMIDSEAFSGTDSLLQYFWDIRINSINIMQNRNFSIEERLNILKSFYTELEILREEALSDTKDYYDIEMLLENFADDSMDFDPLKGESFVENTSFYNSILNDNIFDKVIGARLKDYLGNLRKDILNVEDDFSNISCNTIAELNLNSSNKVSSRDFELSNYSYIFENYLVNQIFKNIIPFNRGENLSDSIKILINSYRIIKGYLLCSYEYSHEMITENQIIKIIQALSKDTEHNKVFKFILENS
ncbi:flagellin lysine-N-methylase [Clostridium sardiniense]|uniref:flagellin lysine-N-methylase n=1 Tax=Clostridium sardiniense TaxID=29369 RepID=UPI001959C28A|nr:flagellin lysine-N-methylase [Clostridium sardiniense]MBM7833319.1 lysine-N-methylase [Clostridium sardiniense]